MKIMCAYSSVEFTCEHFPGTFYAKEAYHPIFLLPQRKLLPYIGKWAAGELTPTDSYLLFLALLRSSELVDFRVPVFRNEHTDALVANNMEYLIRTILTLNTVTNPGVHFPQFVITADTRFLQNVQHWIAAWNKIYHEMKDGHKTAHDWQKLNRRDMALQRMIKSPHRKVESYSSELAMWAEAAAEFPTFQTSSPWTKGTVAINEYWKEIIRRCTKNEQLFSIQRKDLQELLEHCEEHIQFGSIQSNLLFKVLRAALEKQKNFLGLGDMDIKSSFAILDSSDDVESAQIKTMIQVAPVEEPRPEQYPTKLAYLRAKMRFDMATKYKKEQEGEQDV